MTTTGRRRDGMSLSDKPKILFLCDRRNWAFDTTAQHLTKYLENEFECHINYVIESPHIDTNQYDLIYVFWWGEKYHRKFRIGNTTVVKEISSHRWQYEDKYGKHSPSEALVRYMHDADHLVVTSTRLFELFSPHHSHIHHYSLGVDTEFFQPHDIRAGELKIGWAGNPSDPCKNLFSIVLPACIGEFQLIHADGKMAYTEMPAFFNQIDVICVASDAEGTPLPLIEAMACGCFPVVTDVGVARELVVNGKNGLIVDATPEAFREALEWCRVNLKQIRAAGLENSKLIQSQRTWSLAANQFAENLRRILKMENRSDVGNDHAIIANGYSDHFDRINPAGSSDGAYQAACDYYKEDIEELLPSDLNATILEVGTGQGHFLRFLADKGFERVCGIDLSAELLNKAMAYIGHRVERLTVADAREFLPKHQATFDCVVMLDMIEHVTYQEAVELLLAARMSLRPSGRLILRTPNMANLLGCYSLFMDPTHRHGYTEWTLSHALEQAGFQHVKIHQPQYFSSIKRRLFAWINRFIHLFIYHINDRAMPSWFGKNLVAIAFR